MSTVWLVMVLTNTLLKNKCLSEAVANLLHKLNRTEQSVSSTIAEYVCCNTDVPSELKMEWREAVGAKRFLLRLQSFLTFPNGSQVSISETEKLYIKQLLLDYSNDLINDEYELARAYVNTMESADRDASISCRHHREALLELREAVMLAAEK